MKIAALLVIAAMTFSTDFDGALMRLPGWMQTMTIPAVDTFGTAEHARYGTRRVTKTTVAATIAAPAAFYERAYYVSEGASNVWDTSLFGPLSPSADSFSFEFNAGPFYVPHSTNDPPLTVTNTLRLVEHKNIVRAFENGMRSLIDDREDGRLPLARPSWDSEIRRVFWSHTSMPDSVEPKEIHWTDTATFLDEHVSQWFVPLAACPADLNALHEHSFADDQENHKDSVVRQFFREVTFGEDDLHSMIPDPGYTWYTNSVRDVISRSFGAPGDSRYSYRYEGESLRLLSDDYTDVQVSFQRESLGDFLVKIYDEPWEPWNELSKQYLYENFYGYDEPYADYGSAEFTAPFSRGSISAWFPTGSYEPVVSRTFEFDLTGVPDGADVVEFGGASPQAGIRVASSNGWASADGTYVESAGWIFGEPNEVQMTAYKTVVVTNLVERRATAIAGACRAAAVMDRTFEIPQRRGAYLSATNYYVTGTGSLTNSPKAVKMTLAAARRTGTLPDVGNWVEFECTFGEGEKYDLPYLKERDMSVVVQGSSDQYPAERDYVGFEGSYLQLDSFGVFANLDSVITLTNSVDVEDLVPANMLPPGEVVRVDFGTSGGSRQDDFILYHESRVWLDGDDPTYWRVSLEHMDAELLAEEMTNLLFLVTVRANVSGSYGLHVTDPLDADTARRLYAFAGPSASCFSTGRAGRASAVCAGGCVIEYVKSDFDRGSSGWPDISNPEHLYEYNYSPIDYFRQVRKYATYKEREFNSMLGWVDDLVKARSDTRQKCMSELAAVAGVDVGNPASAIAVTAGMLTGGEVRGETLTLTIGPRVWSVPGAGTYYARNNGGTVEVNTKPDWTGLPVSRLDYYMQIGKTVTPQHLGTLPVDDQKVDGTREKRPFAANGKAAAMITTDWKWKALGTEE